MFSIFEKTLFHNRFCYCLLSNFSFLCQLISFLLSSKELQINQGYIYMILFISIIILHSLYIFKNEITIITRERNFLLYILPSLAFNYYMTFYENNELIFYLQFMIIIFLVEMILKQNINILTFNTCLFIGFGVRLRFFRDEIVMSLFYLFFFLLFVLRLILKLKVGKIKKNEKEVNKDKISVKSILMTNNLSDYDILNNFKEGMVLFDSNLKIKWFNNYVFPTLSLPSNTPTEILETKILRIRQDQNSNINNELKQKMKMVCSAFQTKCAILSEDIYHDKTRRECTFKTMKTLESPTITNMSLRNKETHEYYLNQNGTFDVQNIKPRGKYLREFLKDILKRSQNDSIEKNSQIIFFEKFNLYGTIKIPEKSLKKFFLITFHGIKGDILVCLRELEQNDLIISLQNNHLNQNKQLASICHELRTPINSVTNILEMLKEQLRDCEGSNREYLNHALTNSKLLLGSINDFIDYFSISARIFDMEIQETNLEILLKELKDLYQWMIESKLLDFKIDIDKKTPKNILTDPKRLKQILINLISNALRYTSKGSINLKIKPKSNECIKISITDTGIGIDSNLLNNLGNFSSVLKKDNSQQTGGFGLSVANHLANYLGPHIETKNLGIFKGLKVKTARDCGTTFSFLIRNCTEVNSLVLRNLGEKENDSVPSEEEFESPDCEAISNYFEKNGFEMVCKLISSFAAVSGNNEKKKNCNCPKVFAVDDNPFNLYVLTENFKKLGIPISVANNGMEAIGIISKILNKENCEAPKFCEKCGFFKLILMDIDMPIKNGYETTSELKVLFKNFNKTVPIVALSAFSQADHKRKAEDAGMNFYLEKPFTQEKLNFLVSTYLDNRRNQI